MKSLAAVLVEQRKPLVLEQVEVPALTYGQVLVRVFCSGICGSQLGEIDGVKGPDGFLPHLLGHEGVGEVLETGDGVATVSVGQRVVLHWRPGAGLQAPPPRYRSPGLGTVNAGWVTTFNEFAVVSENRITAIPADFDIEAGTLMGCAVTTGFGVINNNAGVKIGQSVIVWGAGGIGLSVVQGAALVGAHPIVAVDLHRNRLDLARVFGATHTVNADHEDAEATLRSIVGANGADVVIENTGNPRVIEAAYRLTGERGRTVLVGVPPKGGEASLYTLPLHFEKTVVGSHGGEAMPAVDIPRYVGLVAAGRLDLSAFITAHYTLTDINRAIDEMRNGTVAGRCLVQLSEY